MNAIDPTLEQVPAGDPALPPIAVATEVLRLLRRLVLSMAGCLAALLALRYGTTRLAAEPILALRQSAVLPESRWRRAES